MKKTATSRKKPSSSKAGIGDEAVRARTGKAWREWISLLDRAGARRMVHKEIASVVADRHPEIGGWWAQMVTVGYEQARGLREKHETPAGYQISGSKTVAVPLPALFAAWSDPRRRERWLPRTPMTIRKATANRSMRITWTDGASDVDANFYAKGAGKSQVAVQHGKLRSAKEAARAKEHWARALERMKSCLERD
jgi:hypothetical protein